MLDNKKEVREAEKEQKDAEEEERVKRRLPEKRE